MKAEKFFTHPLGIAIAAGGTTFLWGSAFPFIKLSYQELSIASNETFKQLLFAGYRFFLASILILLFNAILSRGIRYKRGTLPKLVKIGLFQTFLQYLFFYIGLSYSSGIQGSIIAGTTSFFQILIAHFLYQNDQFSVRKGIGLFIGFLGVIIANVTKGSLQLSFGLGEILLLVAMFCGAMGNIFSKNEARHMDILYMTAYQMFFGGLGLTLVGASQTGFMPFHFTSKTFLILIYLSVLSAAGFVLWNNVMKFNKVGHVSMYLFLIPVFGVMLSALLLHESLHLIVLAALVFVVSGIIIVNREKEHKSETNPIQSNIAR